MQKKNSSETPVKSTFSLQELRKRQVWGLILLAVAAVLFTVERAGLDRVFPPGWWRIW